MQPAEPDAAHQQDTRDFRPLGAVVIVVSDTRDLASDRSGLLIEEKLTAAGHHLLQRLVVADDQTSIQQQVRHWAARAEVHTLILTGGTGVTQRDVTPEAVEALYDKALPGFGELFRSLSYQEIGSSTIQSRATAGVVSGKLLWALPGSIGACRLALDEIILPQLDHRTKPCSFPALFARM